MKVTSNLLEQISQYINAHFEEEVIRFTCSNALFEAALPLEEDEEFLSFDSEKEAVESVALPCASAPCFGSMPPDFTQKLKKTRSIDEMLKQREATFSEALFYEIDARALTDPEVYKRAHIDRKLFSKIRSNADYQPKKSTAISLALALHMNLDETLDFIGRAGYTLSTSSKADLIVMYFLEQEFWNITTINEVLHQFDQPILCC